MGLSFGYGIYHREMGMNLEPKEKYMLEYSEIGELRRHYSTVRVGLSTFCMTVSLAAFMGYFAQPLNRGCVAFIGFVMLGLAALVCLLYSFYTEKTNLYAEQLWHWFGSETKDGLPRFNRYRPKFNDALLAMLRDEMNWVMLFVCATIVVGFYLFK